MTDSGEPTTVARPFTSNLSLDISAHRGFPIWGHNANLVRLSMGNYGLQWLEMVINDDNQQLVLLSVMLHGSGVVAGRCRKRATCGVFCFVFAMLIDGWSIVMFIMVADDCE